MATQFKNWHLLWRHYLKRDWQLLLFWGIGLSLFAGGFLPAFKEIASGQGLVGLYETMKNPAMIAMVGPTPALTVSAYELGALYTQMMLVFCGIVAMIITTLHVIKHTRLEEESGLSELIRSFQVGRHANVAAIFIEVVIINLMTGLLTSSLLKIFGTPTFTWTACLLFGLAITGAGILVGSLALLLAQLANTATGATTATLGIIGALYLTRALTDIASSSLSVINPFAWFYLTYPFSENHWWPLIAIGLLTSLLVAIALRLESRRDLGTGFWPQRQGPSHAKKGLLSFTGLFVTLNLGVIVSWLLTFVIMGAAYGSIYGNMQTFLEGNDLLKQLFEHSGGTIEASFTATIMAVLSLLVSILPLYLVSQLFREETSGRLSMLLSTKVTRRQAYWTTLGVSLLSSFLGLCLAAGGLGLAALSVMKGPLPLSLIDFLSSGLNLSPVLLVMLGLVALTLGWAPKLLKATYGYLIYSLLLSYFSGILHFPQWLKLTAITNWFSAMPVDSFKVKPFVLATLLGLLLILLGAHGYQKRDLVEGN